MNGDEFEQNHLFPRDVRKIAATVPRCKEMKTNGDTDTLSFMLIDASDEPARIQVYCKTGTIGVCRVLNREVREIFCRKCTLRQVHAIFNCPMMMPNVDPATFNVGTQDDRNPRDGEDSDHHRESWEDLKKDEQIVDIGLTILASEFDSLMNHFKSLIRERQRREKRLEDLKLAKQHQLQQNLNPKFQQQQQRMLMQQHQRQQQMRNVNPPHMMVKQRKVVPIRPMQPQQQQIKMQIYQQNNSSHRNNNMEQFKKQQMRNQMRQIRNERSQLN